MTTGERDAPATTTGDRPAAGLRTVPPDRTGTADGGPGGAAAGTAAGDTAGDTAGTARPGADGPGAARQLGRVVAAEWIKARSVSSTWSALGTTAFVLVVIGLVISGGIGGDGGPGAGTGEPLPQVFSGQAMAQVALGVLGALLVTGEYSSRSITGTLAAVPQRGLLLAGKALVAVLVTAPVVLPACVLAAVVCLPALRRRGVTGLRVSDPGVARAVLGIAVVLVLTALLGLAVGTLLRSTAGAVVVITVLLFLVPVLVGIVPGLARSVGPWLPSQAGAAVLMLREQPGFLDPGPGLALAAGYTFAALAAAAVALRRRDA